MEFKNAVTNNDTGTKTVPKGSVAHVTIEDVVFVYNADDHEIDFNNLKTVEDILQLDEVKSNVLLHTKPPLFSAYKGKNKAIETYVKVGDRVIYRNPAFSPIEGNPELTVSGIEIKSLNDMTVVIANFAEGDFALTNHLKKV